MSGGGSATASSRRPGLALLVTVAVFGAGALGVLAYKVDYSTTTFFKKEVDAVEGFKVIGEAFPKGLTAPSTVLVIRDGGAVTEADVKKAALAVQEAPGVAAANPTGLTSDDGSTASIDLILDGDPYTKAALNEVPGMRESVSDLGPGVDGAHWAEAPRSSTTSTRRPRATCKLIAPLALLVIAIILAILLRSLVAPLVLIASVDALVPGDARDLDPDHPLHRRRRRLRRLDTDLRLHLPGRAGDRLHDLPDGQGARGGARTRDP